MATKKVRVIKSGEDYMWHHNLVGKTFTVKQVMAGGLPHRGSVIVATPDSKDGWLWPEDFEYVEENKNA